MYYKRESRWYDSTRGFFLFGRDQLALLTANFLADNNMHSILEIGCGTGYMERELRANGYGEWYCGLDISIEMLKETASKNSRTLFLGSDIDNIKGTWDCVLFSYPLTLMSDWRQVLDKGEKLLSKGGIISVVDFYHTSSSIYQAYMNLHQIGINQGTKEYLNKILSPLSTHVLRSKYRLWEYFYGIWQQKI